MFSEQGARRCADRRVNAGGGGVLQFVFEGICRALGHALIALIIAGGFVKIAYVEAGGVLRRGLGGARARTSRASGAAGGVKIPLGKAVSPR